MKLPIADCRLPIVPKRRNRFFFSIRNWQSKIGNSKRFFAFTLIELMVVVAIIGLIAAMGIPYLFANRHEAPMRKAVSDILEICSRARAGAILNNTTTTVVFSPRSGEVELQGGDSNVALSSRVGNGVVTSAKFDPGVNVEALGINLKDFTEMAAAPVRFFKDGTCDEMTLILNSGGHREMISLELTTALASVKDLQ